MKLLATLIIFVVTLMGGTGQSSVVAQETDPLVVDQETDCWDNITHIWFAENFVNNSAIPRTYVLCPDTIYTVGRQSDTGVVNGMNPLSPRANVHYKCGNDGSAANNCILDGGDFQLVSFGLLFDEDHVNVLVEGLTFRNAFSFGLLLAAPGTLTFKDCVITNHQNNAPVAIIYDSPVVRRLKAMSTGNPYIDLYEYHNMIKTDQLPKVNPEEEEFIRSLQVVDPDALNKVIVTFDGCLFEGNKGFIDESGFARPGIITADVFEDELVFDNCVFRDNNYGNPGINALGWAINCAGPISIKNTCFIDNNFRRQAPVMVFDDAPVIAENNYGTEDDELVCQFIANFPNFTTFEFLEGFTCIEFDSPTCDAPTREPTTVLTPAPTPGPQAPTRRPGSRRTPAPTITPTITPTMPQVTPTMPPVGDSAAAATSKILFSFVAMVSTIIIGFIDYL